MRQRSPTAITDPLKQLLHLLPATASLTVILIAGAALVGWALDLPSLTSLLPGLPAMSVSAALAFLLAAVGLWLLPKDRITRVRSWS